MAEWVYCEDIGYLLSGDLPEVCILTAYLVYDKAQASSFLASGRCNGNSAIVIIGYCPSRRVLAEIRQLFINARIRPVLGSDVPGIVLSCKIALWLKSKDAAFRLSSGQVVFYYETCRYACDISDFSLYRFCRITGFRTDVKLLKSVF